MNMVDERALNDEIQRSLSGSNDELSLTARRAARSIMTGKLIKQGSTRFTLEFTVTDTETRQILAAYSQTHSDIELSEGFAVNKAAESLLKDLGVMLNNAGRYALYGSSNAADTALAKGLNAAETGQGLQAMNYLFNAASYNTTASQASPALAAVQTKNQKVLQGAGAIVMDYFERQELWQGRLDEYNNFYRSHAPFELFYTPPIASNMRGSGDDRSFDLFFSLGLRWNQNQISVMEKVLQEYIIDGLYKNPEKDIQAWALRGLPDDSPIFKGPDNFVYDLAINVENERGEIITQGNLKLYGSLYRYQDKIYASCTQKYDTSFTGIKYVRDKITPQLFIRIVKINSIDIKTVGENGFIRVAQTQGNELPLAQPNNLPRGLVVLKEKELAAARERQQKEAELLKKQREADQKAAQKAAKARELAENPLRTVRLGAGAYGGPVFQASTTATIAANLCLGIGGGTFEAGVMFYPGILMHLFKDDSTLLGLNANLNYTYVGSRTLFHIGPGLTVLMGEEKPDPGLPPYLSSEKKYLWYFSPNVRVAFDWRLLSYIYLRVGYRLDAYTEDLLPIFENGSFQAMGKFFFTHNALFGLQFYM